MTHPLTMYITAHTVLDTMRDPARCDKAMARLRETGFGRVVIEGYRGGCIVDETTMRETRDAFRDDGFETLGGLMPVRGGDFGPPAEGAELRFPNFCYSSEASVAALEEEIRKLARVFDEVVIDDAFFTSCRCSRCSEARGERAWDVFRRDLLTQVGRRWVAAAHEENARVRLAVKFPQYYDRFHLFGYDAHRFPQVFDAVWQGTETRDPDTFEYGYVEPYEGYFNVLWMRECAGEKLECAWFDYLDCDVQLFYEQAVTTFLANPGHVTVFCYGAPLMDGGMADRLAKALPALGRLRDAATGPQGVHVIKPPNSDGGRDLFLFDYLGMLGIPCVPATSIEESMRSAIVPAHALEQADACRSIADVITGGRQVIATFDALSRMDTHTLALFGFEPRGVAHGRTEVSGFEVEGDQLEVESPWYVAGDLDPTDADVPVWATVTACERGSIRVPFATVKSHPGGGRAVVWNLGTFGHDAFSITERLNVPVRSTILALPQQVVDLLRGMATAPLGFSVSAPPRVACFLFARHLVLVNYAQERAEVTTEGIDWEPGSLFADSQDTACSGGRITVAPRSFALLERRTDD